MYEATDLFKKAISQPYRELSAKVTIEEKEYTGSDVQSINVEESILDGESFKFGSSNASTFDLTLLNMDESLNASSFENKELKIEIGAVLDKFHRPVEFVSLGTFIIEKATKEGNLIKLTGFDKMIYFEKPYVSNLTYPTTLRQILQEICSLAGVELENRPFLNENFVVNNKPDFDNISLRIALGHISQLACGFAMINRNDRLELITLTETPIQIDQSNYYNMNLSEYEYGPIEQVVINNDGVAETIGEGNNILEISNNLFATTPTQELLTNIFNSVKDFKFKPFKTSWQGNVLTSPGDIISVKYKNGETYKSFIAKQKFNFSNGLKCDIETNAKTQLQVEYQTKGTLSKDIAKTKAEIKNLGDEIQLRVTREEFDESVAEIKISADEVKTSVENLETNMSAQFTVMAEEISSKITSSEAQSIFTQTASSFTFSASQINFNGHVFGQGATFSGNITTAQNVAVGNNITLGTISDYNSRKEVLFNGSASIHSTGFQMGIIADNFTFDVGSVSIIGGLLSLKNVSSIDWGTHKPVAVWG